MTGKLDSPVERSRIAAERLGTGNGPQDGLRFGLKSEKSEVELEVVARPGSPCIDQAQHTTVAAEAPTSVGSDGARNRRPPQTFNGLSPRRRDSHHTGSVTGLQFQVRHAIVIPATHGRETEQIW